MLFKQNVNAMLMILEYVDIIDGIFSRPCMLLESSYSHVQ